MRPNITISRNEAWIDSPRFSAYYGPQKVDENTEEWVCLITKNGKEVFSASNSQLLEVSFGESPESLLLAGLALWLAK